MSPIKEPELSPARACISTVPQQTALLIHHCRLGLSSRLLALLQTHPDRSADDEERTDEAPTRRRGAPDDLLQGQGENKLGVLGGKVLAIATNSVRTQVY
jgi:hypothetical protein